MGRMMGQPPALTSYVCLISPSYDLLWTWNSEFCEFRLRACVSLGKPLLAYL